MILESFQLRVQDDNRAVVQIGKLERHRLFAGRIANHVVLARLGERLDLARGKRKGLLLDAEQPVVDQDFQLNLGFDFLRAEVNGAHEDQQLVRVLLVADRTERDQGRIVDVLGPRFAGGVQGDVQVAQREIGQIGEAAVGKKVDLGRDALGNDIRAVLPYFACSQRIGQTAGQAERLLDARRPLRLLNGFDGGAQLPAIVRV